MLEGCSKVIFGEYQFKKEKLETKKLEMVFLSELFLLIEYKQAHLLHLHQNIGHIWHLTHAKTQNV